MKLREALQKPILEHAHRTSQRTAGKIVQSGATTLSDLLAPDGVDRRWGHMIQVGDSYLTTLELRGLPPMLDLAWLTDPALDLDAPGITFTNGLYPFQMC